MQLHNGVQSCSDRGRPLWSDQHQGLSRWMHGANMFWKQRWHGRTVEVQGKSLHKQVLTTILCLCSQATQLKLHEKMYDVVNLKPPFFFFSLCFLPLETSSLQEVSEPNRASIYRSLTINISKEMMCYSDFPIPADYPNYMHHSKILTYFRMYAEHFKLMQYIRFQVTESTWAERSGSFSVLLQFKTIPTNQSTMCILDLSEERETGTRLFTHRKMGSSDWENRWTAGEACLWCSHLLHWPLHLP